MRLGLMTTECVQVGGAMEALITRHRADLKLVVTSNVERPQRGGALAQTIENLRRSGPAFIAYLALSFPLYDLWLSYDRLRSGLGLSRRRRSIAELCAEYGIRHIEADDVNGPEVLGALREEQVELLTIYWFDQILRQATIDAIPRGVVNFHAALLPSCRGLFPVLFTIAENEARFGMTAHEIVDETVDTGPILGQIEVAERGATVLDQDDLVNRAGVPFYSEVLEQLEERRSQGESQSGGSYFSYPTRGQLKACRDAGFRIASPFALLRIVGKSSS